MSSAQKQVINNAATRDTRFRKTQICSFFREGRCRYGEACAFAHTQEELESSPDLVKTALCKLWKAGTCKLSGMECRFAHGMHELRERASPCKAPPSAPPSSQVPQPVKFGRNPIKQIDPTKIRAEAWDVLEPMTVTPLTPYSERMALAPFVLDVNSQSLEPSLPPAKNMLLSRWDRWDSDTAVGDTSSEDDGGCPSPFFESEQSVADMLQQVPGQDLRTPSIPKESFVQYPKGLPLRPPPGLEDFARGVC